MVLGTGAMNYARFITAKSAARRPSPIRVYSECGGGGPPLPPGVRVQVRGLAEPRWVGPTVTVRLHSFNRESLLCVRLCVQTCTEVRSKG